MKTAQLSLLLIASCVLIPAAAAFISRAARVDARTYYERATRAAIMAARPPFTYRRLDHIVLRCASIEEMLRFYVDVLGATPEWLNRFDGTLHHVRVGDSLIDLVASDCKLAFAKDPPE